MSNLDSSKDRPRLTPGGSASRGVIAGLAGTVVYSYLQTQAPVPGVPELGAAATVGLLNGLGNLVRNIGGKTAMLFGWLG